MARDFTGVGGYLGHGVYAALDPIIGFDHIYTFEPVTHVAQELRRIDDIRLTVLELGYLPLQLSVPFVTRVH